jgi:hypothetical protein
MQHFSAAVPLATVIGQCRQACHAQRDIYQSLAPGTSKRIADNHTDRDAK